MLSVRVGDTPDELVGELVEHLRAPLGDPFQHEWISVPSLGFRSWLRFRLAEQLAPAAAGSNGPDTAEPQGIAANLDLPFPGTLRWLLLDAHARHHGLTHEVDPWQVDRLVWAVMAVLADPAAEVDDRLRPGRRPGATLAGRAGPIADLFDRYSIHRPHMVKAWSEGRDVGPDGRPLAEDQAWQPRLYRAVRSRVEALHGTRPPAERLTEAIDLAARGQLDIVDRAGRSLPERLFVVGQSIIPADLGPIVVALAEQRDVTVLLLSPSARASVDRAALSARLPPQVSVDSWAFPRASETAAGPNALLARWGMRPMESALLLGAGGLELSPVGNGRVPPVEGDGPPTLLARIRSDVRAGVAPAGDHPEVDGSIQVHAAPGATRQVEVLRDVLLHLLREDPTLTESDIAVVCPQLGDYAPILSAVLGPSAARGEQPLPDEVPALRYTVIDRDARSFNPVLSAMTAILEHLPGRFDTSVVRDLLHAPAIQARFGLEPDDLDLLSRWIEHARIRWGLDRHHRSEWGVGPDHRANSWASGVDQLMMGVALGQSPAAEDLSEEDGSDRSAALAVGPVIPMAVDESSIAAAGRLTTAVRALARAHRILMSPPDRPGPSPSTEPTPGEPARTQPAALQPGDSEPGHSEPGDSQPAGHPAEPLVDPGGDEPEEIASPEAAGSSDGSVRRTVTEWRDRLVEVADLLVRPERFEDWQRARFDDALAQLTAASAAADGTPAPTRLTFGDIRRLLAPALEGQRVRADLGFGTVVFARPSVLAGVPYRVIAVLGLDEAALPGRIVDGDDLMAAEAFVGDREPRAEARAELLGSLLEARDHLIITCSSRDVRTNEAVPHAVVLDELLDTVEATLAPPPAVTPGDQDATTQHRSIVRAHPRQGYDPSNFSPDGDGPFSFDPTSRTGALALASGASESGSTHPPGVLLTGPLSTEWTDPHGAAVALADLRAFFKHPVRTFLRNTLGITLPRAAEEEDTLLPVALGGLDNWAVGEALLDAHAALSLGGSPADPDAVVAEVTETFRIRGVLPPESVARPRIDDTLEEVMELVSRADELGVSTAASDPVPVDVTLGSGERLHGVVDAGPHGLGWTPGLPTPGPVTLSYSRYKPGRLLGVALDLLALGAAHPEITWRGVVITRSKTTKGAATVFELRLRGESPAARRASCTDALDHLVAQYRDGSRLPLPLFDKTSHLVVTPGQNGQSQMGAARSAWGEPQGRSWGSAECRDPYHQMAFGPLSFDELGELDLGGHTLRGEAERLWHTITGAIHIEDLT